MLIPKLSTVGLRREAGGARKTAADQEMPRRTAEEAEEAGLVPG